jgi:hypothetical protein
MNTSKYPAQCVSRDGVNIVVFTDQGGGDRPLLGAYYLATELYWVPTSWRIDGSYSEDGKSGLDIVEEKVQVEVRGDYSLTP